MYTKPVKSKKTRLPLSPTGGQILWLPWRGVLKTPSPRYQGRSHFRLHIVESYFETYKNHDHMQKFGAKPQKFSEISGFQTFVKLRFRITLTIKKWLYLA